MKKREREKAKERQSEREKSQVKEQLHVSENEWQVYGDGNVDDCLQWS